VIKCRRFLEQLGPYLDGESDVSLREDVERHIGRCHDCWVVVDSCKKTISIYQCQELQPIPSALHERLMKALEARCHPDKSAQEPTPET